MCLMTIKQACTVYPISLGRFQGIYEKNLFAISRIIENKLDEGAGIRRIQ